MKNLKKILIPLMIAKTLSCASQEYKDSSNYEIGIYKQVGDSLIKVDYKIKGDTLFTEDGWALIGPKTPFKKSGTKNPIQKMEEKSYKKKTNYIYVQVNQSNL